ncbi:uncharacterized protein LOC106058816 [Biomphalaria glabrata]|uniref:Uncharacterized protein LOC106058816 n=1 Tax=Biomphalaria glabrata TaxID=6526 RepID=A0A9W3B716_BIOGL|nr:uncharacterized protein LOC106058816 [Biomphalaria glabrata]
MAEANKVKIVTRNNASFEGTLHHIDEFTGKIVLKNVVTDGVKLFGPQHFYSTDIIELQYIKDVPVMTQLLTHSREKVKQKNQLYKKPTRPQYKKVDSNKLTMAHVYKDISGTSEDDNQVTKEDFEDFCETDQYIIINKICDKFYQAISHILEQSVVGLQLDGVSIGRNGTLSVVEIVTESRVIIFDILRLGNKAFSEGLREILENSDIMKVTHDCRFLSDMIYHKYKISLNNIFDTQVASAIVHRIYHKGDWPRYVESLPSSLMKHLHLSYDQIHMMRTREHCTKDDEEDAWLQRPLPQNLLKAVSKNLSYLIRLHTVLHYKMLLEFQTGVKVYLNHVDHLGGDVDHCQTNRHLLPKAFTDLHHFINLYNVADQRKVPDNSFKASRPSLKDKNILLSRDSVHSAPSTIPSPSLEGSESQATQSGRRTQETHCHDNPVENKAGSVHDHNCTRFKGQKLKPLRSSPSVSDSDKINHGFDTEYKNPSINPPLLVKEDSDHIDSTSTNINRPLETVPSKPDNGEVQLTNQVHGYFPKSNQHKLTSPSSHTADGSTTIASKNSRLKHSKLFNSASNNSANESFSTSDSESNSSRLRQSKLFSSPSDIPARDKILTSDSDNSPLRHPFQQMTGSSETNNSMLMNDRPSTKIISPKSLLSAASDSESGRSSPPGRVERFCEFLQNLSLGSDDSANHGLTFNDDVRRTDKCDMAVDTMELSEPSESPRASSSSDEESCSSSAHDNQVKVNVLDTIPAGMRTFACKKNMKFKSRTDNFVESDDAGEDARFVPKDQDDEEYGYIPMQHSLHRSKLLTLASAEVEPVYACEESDPEAGENENQLHTLQKVLKLVSTQDIKRKLLPSKLKL